MSGVISKPGVFLLLVVSTIFIGYIDYMTGIETRIFPLYFIPLVFAAWYLGKGGAFFLAFLATVAWIASMYFGGQGYSHEYIWGINFFTQGGAFVAVTLLVARLNDAFKRESALSRTDALTGLFNSRFFYEQASILLALCHRNMRPELTF